MGRQSSLYLAARYAAAVLVCSLVWGAAANATEASENILILIADDVNTEHFAPYGEHPDPVPTPNIDQIAAEGVLFRNVWSNPMCSTTRATLQTGRYSFRTGLGRVIRLQGDGRGLPLKEVMLPEMLTMAPTQYSSGLFGKWHLGDHPNTGDLLTPNKQGWEEVEATPRNLDVRVGIDEDYFQFKKMKNGVAEMYDGYATTGTVDWFVDWVQTAPEPWIAWVAFHAPHSPWHSPPDDLHTQDLTGAGDPNVDKQPYYRAMIEAMDTEIGRLMTFVDTEDTNVIFMGDNGGNRKTTVWQGGVLVPFIVSGPRVTQPGSETEALVNTVDLFATVAEIGGVDLETALPGLVHDSVSFVPYLEDPSLPSIRSWTYTEIFEPNGPGPYLYHDKAIREERFKLVNIDGIEILIDLDNDPEEMNNLLDAPLSIEAEEAYDFLRAQITELAGSQ